MIARARAEPMPRHRATAALVALVLMGLPVGARSNEIGMQDSGSAEPAEGAATDTETKGLEFLVTGEARGVNTEELLEDILMQLRCMAFQQRFDEKPGAGPPGLGVVDGRGDMRGADLGAGVGPAVIAPVLG